MTDRIALRKLGKTAKRWGELAEARRDYFRELYDSGRWRRYYKQEQMVTRLHEIARLCDRWALLAKQIETVADELSDQPKTLKAEPPAHRHAA